MKSGPGIYNLLPYLTGQEKESPRKLFVYITDDGDIMALRYDNWKCVFLEQRCKGTLQVWAEPFTRLRVPKHEARLEGDLSRRTCSEIAAGCDVCRSMATG